MPKSRIAAVLALCFFTAVQVRTAGQAAPQQPAPAAQGEQAAPAQQGQGGQPTFRAGINFVRVDVIVTDRKEAPVTDLTQADFEVLEDGKPQPIEQFRLIKVDGNARPGGAPPRQIRTREDEQTEASRDDVRIFAILLDDYHVRKTTAMSVRQPLTQFINTQLRPNDLVAVMYPLTPVRDLLFTNDHASILSAVERFEGRKYDYTPRNVFEQQYARYSTQDVERIRNDIVIGALRGLAVRMGSLREGRKSIIFVSEGFTAMLPPQMQRGDASAPVDPRQAAIAAQGADSPRQQTAEWFAQSEIYSRMREIFQDANRNNASIYSLDPRGLTPFEFGIDDMVTGAPSFATDSRVLQATQDTLRVLAEETDGRAIVNRNTLAQGLAQIARDSSFYYLIGYNSTQAPNDGKFHEIQVRVKRPNVEVRARKGYWAMTAADAIRAENPTPELAKPIQQALATLATAASQSGKYVRTWIGTQRGDSGKTRVTLIWEPLPPAPGAARREQPGRVSLLAANEAGDLVFRGQAPDTALASAASPPAPNDTGAGGVRTPAAAAATAPQRLVFDAAPGRLELRMTVQEAGSGGTLDQEIRTIDVPDLTAPQAAISTPRVYRGRTARDMQTVAADGNALPTPTREFSRAERLLIRFDAYAPGSEQPQPTAVLMNRSGQKMADVPVTAAQAGGTHQLNLGLSSVPAGEYLVEITVKTAAGEAKELVALRVGT